MSITHTDVTDVTLPMDYMTDEQIHYMSGPVTVIRADGTSTTYQPRYEPRPEFTAENLARVTSEGRYRGDYEIAEHFGVRYDAVNSARARWGVPTYRHEKAQGLHRPWYEVRGEYETRREAMRYMASINAKAVLVTAKACFVDGE